MNRGVPTLLHAVPATACTLAFGVTRQVGMVSPMVQHAWCQYSVPYQLRGQTVWVRDDGDDIIIVHVGATGPVEVARHARGAPDSPRLDGAHFPPAPEGALARTAVPATVADAEFLGAFGDDVDRRALSVARGPPSTAKKARCGRRQRVSRL